MQTVTFFVFLAVRGLTKHEMCSLLLAIICMMPISIALAYYQSDVTTFAAAKIASEKNNGISYNSYVPFTTFSILAGTYLFAALTSKIVRLFVAVVLSGVFLFVLASPSRQSVLFVVVSIVAFCFLSRNYKALLISAGLALAVCWLVSQVGLSEHVIARFLSPQFLESDRPDRMTDALNSVHDLPELVFGDGCGIDFESGISNPHNNYVATLAQYGMVGVLLMFLPFLSTFIRTSWRALIHGGDTVWDRNALAFVSLSVFFTLFHSVFGYPHIDPTNAPLVWLGLGLAICCRPQIKARAFPSVNEVGMRSS